MAGHGVCQRSEVRGWVLIIMRSLFCQRLCNKAGRDRRISITLESPVGVVGLSLADGEVRTGRRDCRQRGGGEAT